MLGISLHSFGTLRRTWWYRWGCLKDDSWAYGNFPRLARKPSKKHLAHWLLKSFVSTQSVSHYSIEKDSDWYKFLGSKSQDLLSQQLPRF